MKFIFLSLFTIMLVWGFGSCKSSNDAVPTFCDTACMQDSLKFVRDDHPLKPYVYISANNCNADTITWSFIDMGINRKMGLPDLVGAAVKLHKDYISCFIKDTSYAWVLFNDCSNGRGYSLKIPYNKKENIGRKSSALNRFDPKFDVAEGLVAYTDRGNLFVEDMETGKSAMMTFGAKADIDYDAIHETVDSIHVTPTRTWARMKLGKEWKTFEKNIELK